MKSSSFRPERSMNISHGARSLHDICRSHKLYFDAPYQRGDVWSQEDREKFIDAVFSEADLGSVLLVEMSYENYQKSNADFEVVDGKQRLTTVTAYMNDAFSYRGFLYSELSPEDRRYFDRRLVRVGILDQDHDEEETKIRMFLQLNDTGVRQSTEHLEKVRNMLKGPK